MPVSQVARDVGVGENLLRRWRTRYDAEPTVVAQARVGQDPVIAALTMALWQRQPAPGLLPHSDRSSQYGVGLFSGSSSITGFGGPWAVEVTVFDNAYDPDRLVCFQWKARGLITVKMKGHTS